MHAEGVLQARMLPCTLLCTPAQPRALPRSQRARHGAHDRRMRRRAATAASAAAPDGAQHAAPPYTTLSVPVLSLATAAGAAGRASMNVVTYAAPITILPKRRYSVALYHGTQTLLNVQATGRGVMQILGVQHAHLVPLLGKTRGQDVDKLHELQSVHGMQLQERFGCMTLADCAGAFELTVVHSHDCGDHVLLTCDVGEATPAQLACEPLTTGVLRARGII